MLFHFDGADLTAFVESDDGTTEVAADSTTTDLVDDTWTFLQIDCRDLSDIKAYINGVEQTALADVTLVLSAATGPVLPIVHIEKSSSNNTTADVRVKAMTVRAGCGTD